MQYTRPMLLETDIKQNDYKSSDLKGVLFLLFPLMLAVTGIYMSISESALFFAGQLILGLFFFQCFILLHETGHGSYFKNKLFNKAAGNIFAFLSFIPFKSWVDIHNLHHKWTGYRDKDPTTEGTINPNFGAATKFLVNFCWLLWIPLFTVGYRIGNYWNFSKLKRHVSERQLQEIRINVIIQLSIYAVVFFFFGMWIVKHLLVAYLISLIISDLFILSQHSHIEIPLANKEEVRPLRYKDQVVYTRSLHIYRTIAKLIFFNFNLHELHHAFPGLPAYYLDKVDSESPNKVGFFAYLTDAKNMSGINFIFKTSKKTIGKK